MLEKFLESDLAKAFQGDVEGAALALYIMPTVLAEGMTEEVAIQLAKKVIEGGMDMGDPRFNAVDLAQAILNRHVEILPQLLELDDSTFGTIAILAAQKCRDTWSEGQPMLSGDADAIIKQALKRKKAPKTARNTVPTRKAPVPSKK